MSATYVVLDLSGIDANVHPPVVADTVLDAIQQADATLHTAILHNSRIHRDDRAGGVTLFTYNLSPMTIVWTI